jgi:hypothetical protein
MFKLPTTTLLISLFCLGFSNCQLDQRYRTFKERIRQEDVIRDAKLIRDAQKTYKQKFDSYGSITDLINANLLGSRFEDGEESESLFVLTNEKEHYHLIVTPKAARSENYNCTFYLDESGVIRFSENPQTPANSNSYPFDN